MKPHRGRVLIAGIARKRPIPVSSAGFLIHGIALINSSGSSRPGRRTTTRGVFYGMADNKSTDIRIEAKPDFLKSLASNVSPITAVSELIWNGFDAGAQYVKVILEPNELNGLHAIRVSDDGDGIDRSKVDSLFGGLGDSWKARSHRYKGRTLHGKNGRGRFRAFALGESVAWRTTYLDGKTCKTYTITGRASQLTGFSASHPRQRRRA